MKRISNIILLALVAGSFLSEATLQAQGTTPPSQERSRFQDRRKSILDANNVRATYHNFGHQGVSSGANRDELYYEFPKNTNRQYVYFVAAFIGAEVNNQASAAGAPRFPVVIAPNFRTNPQTGESWAMNPVGGYFNPNSREIARSDRGPGYPTGNTWPSLWPDKLVDAGDPGWAGSWNGFFGKNIFNADQEFYYRAGDDRYTRYLTSSTTQYRPDNTDATRGGLGLIVDSRVLAWTQRLISNVHFAIYEVKNDASFNYDKVSFMLWIADWVGTPQDDRPFFDQQRATAFFTDSRPTASPPEFNGTQIGVAGVRFLETPGNAYDGLDNDGDADFYIREEVTLYDIRNKDLIDALLLANGGFFDSRVQVLNEVLPKFTATDFNQRTIAPGDRIVLIDDDGNRILTTYPTGLTDSLVVRSQGRNIKLPPNGLVAREDTLLGRHLNLLDDDFDGLVDENQPNHLTLSRYLRGVLNIRPVRFVNYRWSGFYANMPVNTTSIAFTDTIQRGLAVPNSWIRTKMANTAQFRTEILAYQTMLRNRYAGTFPANYFDHYFLSAKTQAPMIDESRDDFFDNNQDWRASADDVGLDGVDLSGDTGESDGYPTSGAFSPFPGESAIDKTDVRETDAIGITAATFRPAGGLNLNGPDDDIWRRHLVPGIFSPAPEVGDIDQFVTSGFFPLQRGAIERFALAVSIAASNSSNNASIALVEQQLAQAFNAYDANYQFAIAPPPPPTKAVPGNGYVTLYWDDIAEYVFDRYLARIGANPFNFEGYKIFRSTDAALLDAKVITDGRGTPQQFLNPIAQFDLANGITGNHPIDIFGIEFDLGTDSGLQRYYVDSDVINGRTYYYAIVAYNSGAAQAGISPAESPINLSVNPDGSISAGVNVIKVTPTANSAGYVAGQDPVVIKKAGTGTGSVVANIIDPRALKANNTYRITFRDTTIGADTYAGYFSLTNVTSGAVLLSNRTSFTAGNNDNPVVEGVRVVVTNANPSAPKLIGKSWSSTSDVLINAQANAVAVNANRREYDIVFGAPGMASSASANIRRGGLRQQLESQPVNFKVIDRTTGRSVPFAYLRHPVLGELGGTSTSMGAYFDTKSQTTFSDQIYLLDAAKEGEVSWQIGLEPHRGDVLFRPQAGDTLHLVQGTRFTSADVYEFTINPATNLPSEDLALAKSNMDEIRVVPNPYIVTHLAEKRPTRIRPQQERELHFIHLPARCTIRIFNVAGQLIQTLTVNNPIETDRYVWNMLTKDNLELAYGVYIYHVEAPGIGEKVGKFAVIK